MRADFSGYGRSTFAHAEIPETELMGGGGTISPRLRMNMRLDVSLPDGQPGRGLELVSVNGSLSASNGFLSDAEPVVLDIILQEKFARIQHYITLQFTVDAARIASLERLRSGGDLKCRLDVMLLVRELRAVGKTPESLPLLVWGYVFPGKLMFQADLTIPRDAWVKNVLPNVGYGSVLTIELPAVPVEACQKLSHSFQALLQAQELHKLGRFDDSVGKCRVALDPFFEWSEKRGEDGVVKRVPGLKRSWQTQLGQPTFKWLEDAMRAIKEAADPTHHRVTAHYDQLESQMVFAITTALIAYVARTTDVAA